MLFDVENIQPKETQIAKQFHIKCQKNFTFANGYFFPFQLFPYIKQGPAKWSEKMNRKGAGNSFNILFFLFSNNTYLFHNGLKRFAKENSVEVFNGN